MFCHGHDLGRVVGLKLSWRYALEGYGDKVTYVS